MQMTFYVCIIYKRQLLFFYVIGNFDRISYT
nr:MAG TPA: hypothetical protein [Caudoviricetes sp.]